MDILLTRYFYPCLLFEGTCCNLPATITIETSFLVLQIEITGNFSLRSFEHCKRRNSPSKMHSSDFFRAHWSRQLCCKALVDRQAHVQPTSPSISSSITLSPTLADPALVSVIRVVDGQDTGLSAQRLSNRLQTRPGCR